jgi:hypothetical protein
MTKILTVFLLVSLFFFSCEKNENKHDGLLTIEDQINAARPLNQVILKYRTSSSSVETFTGFEDAYAEDGMLIMKQLYTDVYSINLELADLILVDGHDVEIDYQRP